MCKKLVRNSVFFAFISVILLSMTKCDKFQLDFASENNFNLNSGSHELDVKTKQDYAIMTGITINGIWGRVHTGTVVNGDSVRFDYDEYSVIYRKGFPSEVIGEWFTIKQVDDYTFHISVSENDELIDRSLLIELLWRSAGNTINIRQGKK